MKRRKTMAYNAPGGTILYVGASAQNMVQNRGFLPGVSLNTGYDIYGGKDYSYKTAQGTSPRAFRKCFEVVENGGFSGSDYEDEVFKIGELGEGCGIVRRPVYYFFGWRIVVEYFDVNAVVDFMEKMDEWAAPAEYVMKRFQSIFSGFEVKIINEHLINVFAK